MSPHHEPLATSANMIPNPRAIVLERLDSQIEWYNRKSDSSKRWYATLKTLQMLMTALIPLTSIFGGESAGKCAAVLGALAIVSEGLLQLWRHHENWINFRSTAEALKHEKYLFSAHAGPYADLENKEIRVLAERVEGLISQESGRWIELQRTKAPAMEPQNEERQPV